MDDKPPDTIELTAWLTQILDEEEAIAKEASRKDEHPLVQGGEHWQWVCHDHDEVVTPDPLAQATLECPQEGWKIDLRSVEEYPTAVGNLPHFALSYAEEIPPVVAQHIARHDPAAVLARIAADRQILEDYEDHVATYRADPTPFGEGQRFGLLLALARIAEAHAARPGFREEWRP